MCGGICTISSQNLSGPAPLSHHITTHPKGILAEVAGMAEICGSVVRKKRPDAVDRPASKLGRRMWAVVRVSMSRRMKNDLPPTLAHDRSRSVHH
jgi:hypothetical protein